MTNDMQRFKIIFVKFCNTIRRALDKKKVGCCKAVRCCGKSVSLDQIAYNSRETSLLQEYP